MRQGRVKGVCTRRLRVVLAGLGGPMRGLMIGIVGCGLAACSTSALDGGTCVPGQSITCVGPAGCAGGQICEADGKGYGVCQCASTSGTTGSSSGTNGGSSTSGTTGGSSTSGTTGGSSTSGTTGGSSSSGTTGGTSGAICPGGCGPNSSCVSGVCVCFTGGYAQCGTTDGGQPVCVNTLSDDSNCGGCGNVCPSPGVLTSCNNGNCACLASSCPMPDGGPGCYDTTSDNRNCGSCGNVCGHDQKCVQPTPGTGGQCVCNLTEDGGADLIPCASGCVHSKTDPRNCGMCNVICGTGICDAGAC
jgi:hypothetical protein